MAFDIHFVATSAGVGPNGSEWLGGEIVLGEYRETFEAPLMYWSRRQYEQQWREGVGRAAELAVPSALVTGAPDPVQSEIVWWWWLLYPHGNVVRVQQQLLLRRNLSAPLDHSNIYRDVPVYQAVGEDGQPVSEWQVPVGELADFLARSRSPS